MNASSSLPLLQLPMVRQLLMLLAIAAAVAGGISVFFWSQTPGERVLYAQLDDRDSAQVVEALASAGVPYRLDPASGAILVPDAHLHDARLSLASEGLPAGGGTGFEMMREDPGLGVSQFVESARYHHALETELVRTITSIRAVRAARVHLAIPKPSAFARDRRGASASVFVELAPGRTLDGPQVESIVHLVASSIPDMQADRVAVIDQNGRLMSSTGQDDTLGRSSKQFEHVRNIEQSYVRRIESLLMPMTGPGRISAQVAVDMDFTFSEETRESYNPQNAAVRSEQLSEEPVRGGLGAGGVPGAASNKPGRGNRADAGDGAPATARSTTRNYELDRSISHTRQPSGRIQRVSVAVLVDHIPRAGDDGETVLAPLSDRQIERVQALVREAVGFSEARGDSVSVMNARFQQPEMLEPEPLPLWQQAGVREIARQLLGALVVLLIGFAVLRPMLRNLTQVPVTRELLAVDDSPALPGAAGAAPAMALAEPGVSSHEQKLAMAQSAVQQDPKRVAQVVRNWVGDDA